MKEKKREGEKEKKICREWFDHAQFQML